MIANSKNTQPFYNSSIPSDWEMKELVSIGKISSGGTPDTTNEIFWNGKINWCTPTDITKLNGSKYIGETFAKISDEGLKNSSAILLPKGSVIVCTRATIGKAAISIQEISTNQGFKNIVPNDKKVDVEFLYYSIINSERHLLRLGNGSTFLEVPKSDFKKFRIPLPPLSEQKAIAHILSLMDTAINKNNLLIAKKELQKKYLMQVLLSGKKRLKGFEKTKWRIKPLEHLIKPISREVEKPNKSYIGIGLRSHGKGTFLKPAEQPEKNSMDYFYVVRQDDLIVNITFAWEQAIAIVKPEDDGALASHRFPTFTFIDKKGCSNFFRFYILQKKMKYMLELISPGGAGRNRVMSKSDFIKLEFFLPEFEEQTAIAQVLQAADKEIQLLKGKTEKLREKKKGLMQILLTGKKRVKI